MEVLIRQNMISAQMSQELAVPGDMKEQKNSTEKVDLC